MKVKSIGALLLESLMIILSILVSFYIEDWRQQRADHKKEREYLARIAKDLSADSSLLISLQQRVTRVEQKTTELFLSYDKWEGGKILPISKDSIAIAIDLMTRPLLLFEPIGSAYSSLKSNGQMDLVQNAILADKVIQYYEGQNHIRYLIQNYNDAIKNLVWPYIHNNMDVKDIWLVTSGTFGRTKSDYFRLYSGYQLKTFTSYLSSTSSKIDNVIPFKIKTIIELRELIKKELRK